METEVPKLTDAQILAGIITGDLGLSQTMATVQRSHRFPLHIFSQIENMADMAKAPVSVIINELLECGLESVKKELPQSVVDQIITVTAKQNNRSSKTVSSEVKRQTGITHKQLKKGKKRP